MISRVLQLGFALVAVCSMAVSSNADVVLLSHTAGNNDLAAYLAGYSNVTEVRFGDWANYNAATTQDAINGTGAYAGMGAADVVVIGRSLSSAAYDNGDALGYNTIGVPVVALTSYVARETGTRLGWHDGSAAHALDPAGAEATLSTDGTNCFGGATAQDWHMDFDGNNTFNGSGTGTDLGQGTLLASIGTQILAASWDAGDLLFNGTAAGDDRFLFNLDNDNGVGGADLINLTADGLAALDTTFQKAGLIRAVPEPGSLACLSLLAVGFVSRRRRV